MRSNPKRRQVARDRAWAEWAAPVLQNPSAFPPLRVARVEAGMTQGELAIAASLSRGLVGEIERGRKGHKHSRERIAGALNIDQSEVFPND